MTHANDWVRNYIGLLFFTILSHNLSDRPKSDPSFTQTVWDSLRLGGDSGISTVIATYSLEFWAWRGFDSLHPLHFSTLHSEQFTAAIEVWFFWISQGIQWALSEIWRTNSLLWSLCFCANWWICCFCLCLRRFISFDYFVLSIRRLSFM